MRNKPWFAVPDCRLLILGVLLIAACAGGGGPSSGQPLSVAVWDLEDVSPIPHGRAGIGEVLATQLSARIGAMPGVQVVERQALVHALEELNLGSSALADSRTRLRLGRVVGARQMVFGAFQVAGADLRVDLRRVDVASGKILKTATASAAVDDVTTWLAAADRGAAALMAP